MGTAIVVAILCVLVFFSIRSVFGLGKKKRSNGTGSCGNSCGGCPYGDKCHHC